MVRIYTCITNAYDDLKKQPELKGCTYTAYLEGVNRPLPPWFIVQTVHPDPPPDFGVGASSDPTRRAREKKTLAHVFAGSVEWSLWIDGCFVIRPDFDVRKWIRALDEKGADLMTFEHPTDKCTYEHAERVMKTWTDNNLTVARQMARYRAEGFPDQAGMVQTFVVLRRHNEATRAFNECWWDEIEKGSRRDQLSFMYAAKKTGLKFLLAEPTDRQYFHGKSHRGLRILP